MENIASEIIVTLYQKQIQPHEINTVLAMVFTNNLNISAPRKSLTWALNVIDLQKSVVLDILSLLGWE